MDSNGHDNNNNNNNNISSYNNRKYKRGNSNPKTKKQLENELNRQRSFYIGGPQNHSALHNNNVQVQIDRIALLSILYSYISICVNAGMFLSVNLF